MRGDLRGSRRRAWHCGRSRVGELRAARRDGGCVEIVRARGEREENQHRSGQSPLSASEGRERASAEEKNKVVARDIGDGQ